VFYVSSCAYDVVFDTRRDVQFFSHPLLIKPHASVRFVPEGVVVLTLVEITTQTDTLLANSCGNPIKHVSQLGASGVLQPHVPGTDVQ
jgi:hypothetical protein